ncbi:DNA-binding protein [Paenibacillus sonchi]|uniref:DNA-binding protein n=1 Tax=Paenibacillus sonchi TaxID=373687 RepID=A0A974PAI5_9BACL|nr:hypothetical protein [Paenibacillus sonchi]MCE3201676.1 DNA-binding protein [Paenibacillus sonchi]QQZ60452.1 DNA-binding protein [Paenibacillus sonchi]
MKLDLDGIQADSLVDMLKASFTLENWDSIILIADKLHEEINNIYQTNQQKRASGRSVNIFQLKRSVVYYFGYSMCLKGIALQKLGKYVEARACIDRYSELGWINGMDARGLDEVEYYRNIAVANRYVVDLSEGNKDVLEYYVSYIRQNNDEILPGIIHILESSILHNFRVDVILEEFMDKIFEEAEYYKQNRNIRYFIDCVYLLSLYYSKNGKISDSINNTLYVLTTSVSLNDNKGFRKAAALYESLRGQATAEQQEQYSKLMNKILEERELS